MSIRKSKNFLYNENKKLRKELADAENDIRQFREFIRQEMNTQLENVAESKYTPAAVLIKRLIVTLNKVKPFHLWWV